jgi:hypothetical protein
VLDYDGDAQMKGEPAPGAGGSAEEGDEADEHGDDGSAGDHVLPTTENNAGQQGSGDEDPEDNEQQGDKSKNDDSSSSSSGDDNENEEAEEDSEEEEMEIEEDDFCQATDTGSLQDESDEPSRPNNTIIACTNHDIWGRIRPRGFQNRPSPPDSFPAAFPRPPAPQYTASSPMYYATYSPAAIRAANKRHGYDVNGGIRPPPRPRRPAVRPSKGLRLAERGGLADVPFAGPQTRQNTAQNSMRDEALPPGQGYVSVSIAEQQAAQMLHALEDGEGENAEGNDGKGDDAEGEDAEADGAEADGAEDSGAEDGDAPSHDGNK